jgi:hypothetical protein
MSDDAARQIYFSYKWGGESERIVNEIDAALKARGIAFVRDKADLGYKGKISGFMQEIGRGSAIVVVISDKYLTSPNTMYELVEIARNKDVHDRIFPVVLSDADIYDAARRLKYVKYWEDKKKELNEAMRTVDLANLQGITDDLNSYDTIRDHISGLTSLLKDMNTLTPEMHEDSNFSTLIDSLEKRLNASADLTRPQSPLSKLGARIDPTRSGAAEGSPQVLAEFADDLMTMLNDPQAQGLMVHLESEDGPIDLACVAIQVDGSLLCSLASNGQLPERHRLSTMTRNELVNGYGFSAPDAPGGEYWLRSAPADAAVVAQLAPQLLGACMNAFRAPAEAIGWRLLPDR